MTFLPSHPYTHTKKKAGKGEWWNFSFFTLKCRLIRTVSLVNMKRNKNTRFTISPIFNSIEQLTQVNTNNSHFFNVSERELHVSLQLNRCMFQILINRTGKPIGKITSGTLPNRLSINIEFYKITLVVVGGPVKENSCLYSRISHVTSSNSVKKSHLNY